MTSIFDTPANAEITEAFEQCAQRPSIVDAHFIALKNNLLDITIVFSQRDLKRQTKRKFLVNTVRDSSGELISQSFPMDLGDAGLLTISPSGLYMAISRVIMDSKGKKPKRRFIEIWSRGGLEDSFEVTDHHGDFFCDDTFGGLAWSNDETRIAYVAEKNAPEEGLKRFEYREDWGERFTKKNNPVICILNLKLDRTILDSSNGEGGKDEIKVLDLGNLSCGQVQFVNRNLIIFTGVPNDPFQFGIVYCFYRRSGIYMCEVDGSNITQFTDPKESCRSPRLHPITNEVYYLSNRVGGPHNSTSEIKKYDFETKITVTLIGIPSNVQGPTQFPGLYVDQLPVNCFTERGDLVFSSIWRCQKRALVLRFGRVESLSRMDDMSSYNVLFVRGGYALVTQGTPTYPSRLGIFDINAETPMRDIQTVPIPQQIAVQHRIFPSIRPNVESILLLPPSSESGKKVPLILMPHGGPHSAFTTEYSVYCAGLVTLGFGCLLVNYSGSIGFGEQSISALIGEIGVLDVQDMLAVVEEVKRVAEVDTRNLFLMGGSHGGFLTAHLLGCAPLAWRGACMRNPVINIGAMAATSDIPDWTFAELGLEYCQDAPRILSPDIYSRQFHHSPIAVMEAVVTPTLVLIGEGDRRVPPAEGLRWVAWLKSRGRPVECLVFGDTGHALDSIDAEMVGFEAIAKFFLGLVVE